MRIWRGSRKSVDRRLRVLFLVDRMGYPDGTRHGGTTYFLNTLPALHRSGIDLTVCFMSSRHPAADELEAHGIEPIFLDRAKWDPLAFFDVLRLVRSREIDVLHLASLKSLLFGRWVAGLLKRSAVIHLHDMTPLPPGLGALQRHANRWTSATFIPTRAMQEFTQSAFGIAPGHAQVLPFGFEVDPFLNVPASARMRVRREWGIGDGTPLVVLPGRVEHGKGQEYFIRAVPQLLQEVPSAVVCVVGAGTALQQCRELVSELKLDDRVLFIGYRPDMPSVFAAADAVVVPSVGNEAFGFVALEAMAAGRPVVAFDDGGLPEVIHDGESGLIVPKGDVAQLAAAVARVLTDEALARRLADGGQRCACEFTIEKHVKRVLGVYEEVAGRRCTADATEPECSDNLWRSEVSLVTLK